METCYPIELGGGGNRNFKSSFSPSSGRPQSGFHCPSILADPDSHRQTCAKRQMIAASSIRQRGRAIRHEGEQPSHETPVVTDYHGMSRRRREHQVHGYPRRNFLQRAISGRGNSSAIGSLRRRPGSLPRRSGTPPIQQRDAGRNGTTFDPFRLQASASSTCFVSSATVNGFFISLFCSAPSNFVDPI